MNLTPILLAKLSPLEHVIPHKLFGFHVGKYAIDVDNHMVMIFFAAVSLVIVATQSMRQKSIVPRGMRNLVETICVFIREDIAKPNLGVHADKFICYLWTTFFFILFCNLIGMLPTAAVLYIFSGGSIKHVGGAATTNIWVTATLASISLFMIHYSGVRQQGFIGYFKNFIPHVPWPLVPMMYFLEFAGAAIKPFALAIRLFANILAGHAVLATLIGLIVLSQSYFVGGVTVISCAVFSLLELFVACLQAYIFTFLTALFISSSVDPQH